MVLTLKVYRRHTPGRSRSIPTIPAGRTGAGPANVSAVDTGPRRSEPGVLVAEPGAPVTSPPPPLPDRCLRRVPVVIVRSGPALSLASSRPAPRGSGATGGGSGVLQVGRTFVQYAQPQASRSPPSWNGPPQKTNMPEPTSSVRRQQPDGEPRMSTSETKGWIVLT